MHAALTHLGKLPEDTLVYNGHEYTKGSAKFGLTIEPDNQALKGYAHSFMQHSSVVMVIRMSADLLTCRLMEKAQGDSCTTGKSTMGDEKQWNVFMRLDTDEAK